MSALNDGSEDVDQFLARIASLSKKNDTEDAEQTRRTEEQMLQARKERQARRAGTRPMLDSASTLNNHTERARSISPSKTGPAASTSSPLARPATLDRPLDPPVTFSPRTQEQVHSRERSPTRSGLSRPLSALSLEQTRPSSQSSQDFPQSPALPSPNASGLSRSGTLSWQQRPSSRGLTSGFGSVRSRPLSGSRPQSREHESPVQGSPSKDDDNPSRKDIAASLATRDPAWFRQTQDRGLSSAAYRKSEQDDQQDQTHSMRGQRLPGMTDRADDPREASSMPPLRPTQTESGPATIPQSESPRRTTAAAYISNPGPVPSLPPYESNVDGQPTVAERSSRELDPGLSRTSSILGGRPPSPTKGLGGFVQSAMMRRSDSVSKRWSVQSNSGLKRGDSIASNRSSFQPPTSTIPPLGHARTLSREPRATLEDNSSPQDSSQPGLSQTGQDEKPSMLQKSRSEPHGMLAPQSTRASREVQSSHTEGLHDEPVLSRSPSKTLDPRRWSPTKSTWLESALSKPESPRFSPTKEDPPPWKLDMQRSKSNKDLAEAAKRPQSFEPVNTSGLLRSPAPGIKTKPFDLAGKQGAPIAPKISDSNTLPEPEIVAPTSVPREGRQGPTLSNKGPDHDASTSEEVSTATEGQEPDKTETPTPENTVKSRSALPATDATSDTDKAPPPLRPKPQTPPKTDFRANLKSRAPVGSSNTEEPEFRSVFGKLKKTQTQNYVAPDIFKENITQGKAALAVTGGPQPRKRVDEFKESILAKKDAMRAGGGSIHNRAGSRETSPAKPIPEIPEALRRRNTLHRSKASIEDKTIGEARSPPPTAPFRSRDLPTGSGPVSSTRATESTKLSPLEAPQTSAKAQKPPVMERTDAVKRTPPTKQSTQEPEPKPSRPEVERPLTRSTTQASDTSSLDRSESGRSTPTTTAAFQKKTPATGGLAARLNPALAGLIGRGGSPKPAGDSQSSAEHGGVVVRPSTSKSEEEAGSLSHATKGRARGPKRKAPKAVAAPVTTTGSQVQSKSKDVVNKAALDEQSIPKTSSVRSTFADSRQAFSSKPTAAPPVSEKPQTTQPHVQYGPKSPPVVASKSPELRRVSKEVPPAKLSSSSPPVASKPAELHRVKTPVSTPSNKPELLPSRTSPKKTFDIATDSTARESPVAKSTPQKFGTSSSATMPLTPSRSKLNSTRSSKPSDEDVESPSDEKQPKPPGLGLQFGGSTTPTSAKVLTPPPEKDSSIQKSGRDQYSTIGKALKATYNTIPMSSEKSDFDTEAILKISTPSADRIKSVSYQIWEVTGDGKKIPLPPQQEHVLYEDTMYVVIHTFESLATTKKITECYLWSGNHVPASTVEDAQIFCRKIARENSAKLEVVQQGKESSNLFAALGGIVITRRSKAAAMYMLCGRRHLGHVTFDEVDFHPSSLCSGFPFLISASSGKLYLWKGQGSGADEIGAARLVGMDLGLTGEMEEVSEAKEPAAFWDCFPISRARSHFKSSDIWAMRSMDEKNGFPCRLYRLEAERPKSSGGFWGLRASSPAKESNKSTLTEIAPFAQADLVDGSVHVLDAWASIYV